MDEQLKKIIYTDLHGLLGDRVTSEETIRTAHGSGFSYHDCMPPDYVVYPGSTDEIAAVVKICARHQVPIIPFGAGTLVEGHVLAVRGGVCIDLREMNGVLEVNYEDMYATVQTGVTRNQLDNLLEESGFFFPVGPGVNATLGGMAATRASGTNAVHYGTMKDNVLSLTVVLPNGQVIRTAGKAKKSSAGYDLTPLFIGSEGTLGIIAELTVKLHSCPEVSKAVVCSFPTIEAAINTAIKTIQKGVAIGRLEFMDEVMMGALNRYSGVDYPGQPTLFLEFHGSAQTVQEQIQKVQQFALEFGAESFLWEKDEASRKKLWSVRTDAALAAAALVPNANLIISDVCVPISRLTNCITETQADIEKAGVIAVMLGHVGDGNFHMLIPILPADRATLEKAKTLNERLVQRALAMEGTCSGEHGIGVGKLSYMPLEHGEALDVMRAIKNAIDPKHIMNPGKLLPGG